MEKKCGYFYIIHEREYVRMKENIYKIGMTRRHISERFKEYPKGSVLYFSIICSDSLEFESKIKEIFSKKYVSRLGKERFEGNLLDMIQTVVSELKTDDIDLTKEDAKQEKHGIIKNFLESKHVILSPNKYCPERVLLASFQKFCEDTECITYYMRLLEENREKFNITVRRNTKKRYSNRMYRGNFLIGIDIV